MNNLNHPWRAFDSAHVCYVVQAMSGGPFKVGNATCMSKRLASLQVGNPELLRVRALLSGGDATEGELHRMLDEYSLCGEWFDATALPLLQEMIFADARLLWGSPWDEASYQKPAPIAADARARLREAIVQHGVPSLGALLQDPRTSAKQRDRALALMEMLAGHAA